jgi:cell fate regulator YaaT (PSP1 superfamily)
MTEIISVRFKEGGKAYYFNPNGIQVAPGEQVIIETSRGTEFGLCVEGNRLIDEMELVSPLRPVVRKATENDLLVVEKNHEKEKKAFDICQKKIAEHGLDMKLVEVEYNFDGSKILFFFTSEGRVDFRNLVRDLASVFHTRIELRQIGVRDEAKMLGGLGVCGRPYCCNAFLEDFHPVSIKMAKTQNLSLNPTKISGACGRLMCCLKYEQDAYEDLLKRVPKQESLVETPDGVGTVTYVYLLREQAKVRLDNDPENPQIYSCSDLKVIRSGKGKRPEGYEEPERQERPQRTLHQNAPAPVQKEEQAGEEKKSSRPARPERQPRQERPARIPTAPVETEGKPAEEQEKKPPRRPRQKNRSQRPANQPKQTRAERQELDEPTGKPEKINRSRHHRPHRRPNKPNGGNGATKE